MTPTPTNVFHFADGKVLYAEHSPGGRPQVELIRARRYDYLSYLCGDGYRELLFALESVEITKNRDVAVYRELVS